MDNFSIIVVKKGEICIVMAEGEYKQLNELIPYIKQCESDAKLIIIDRNEYEQVEDDIELLNETLSELIA